MLLLTPRPISQLLALAVGQVLPLPVLIWEGMAFMPQKGVWVASLLVLMAAVCAFAFVLWQFRLGRVNTNSNY